LRCTVTGLAIAGVGRKTVMSKIGDNVINNPCSAGHMPAITEEKTHVFSRHAVVTFLHHLLFYRNSGLNY